MNTSKKHITELIEHLLSAQDADGMGIILENLLTRSEMGEISKRLQIFKLLKSGMPQRQIAETLGVGLATVTRGSNALNNR